MGIIKVKGIVISENNLNDYDKMVTILTPNGKIGCAAKGARRPKSQLMAATQYLCFGNFVIYQGVSSFNINSCEINELFYNIRIDLDKLQYAVHITKIINETNTPITARKGIVTEIINSVLSSDSNSVSDAA